VADLYSMSNIRPRERLVSGLLASNLFILLASYYLLKTAREALILGEAGAEVKSYAAAMQPLILIGAAKAYSFLSSKQRTISLLTSVMLFFVLAVLIFSVLTALSMQVGVVFFLFLGPLALIIVAQFWAYSADLFTVEEGKRLFPIINLGGLLGAWAGAVLAGRLFQMMHTSQVLVLAAVGLTVHTGMYWVIQRVWWRSPSSGTAADTGVPLAQTDVFRLLLSDRYFLMIAGVALLLNVSKSNGEYLLGLFASEQARHQVAMGLAGGLTEQQLLGAVYGKVFAFVNVVGFLIQAAIVPWLFRRIGLRGAILVLPCLAGIMSTTTIAIPILEVVMVARILENSVDYSLQNTTLHGLFLPTSREAKYKVQAVVDTRLGDLFSGIFVFASVNWIRADPRQFAALNTVAVGAWLVLAGFLGSRYKKLELNAKKSVEAL